jgi:hypothetical protein
LVRARILRHRPDLIVGPDLGFYSSDQPASRTLLFHAHTCMYRDLVAAGVAALPPIGWTLASDLDRFASWAQEFEVPGAFLDLQRRTSSGPFDEVVDDLRRYRHRFPDGFMWLVNGVQSRERWEQLRRVLGNVRFTSSGAWHEARNGYVLDPDLGRLLASGNRLAAFTESLSRLTRAAEEVTAPSRNRGRDSRIVQLSLFEPIPQVAAL